MNTLNKTDSSCKLAPTPPFSLRPNNVDGTHLNVHWNDFYMIS